jgi:hypothetical protein
MYLNVLLLSFLAASASAFTSLSRNRAAFRKTALAELPDFLELPSDAYPSRAVEGAAKAASEASKAVVDTVTTAVPDVSEVAKSAVETATTAASEPVTKAVESVSDAAVSLPSVELPTIEMPSLDLGVDPTILAAGVAVLAIGAIIASSLGKSDEGESSASSSAPAATSAAPAKAASSSPAVDLSIPYDAAAMLAYKAAKGTDPVAGPEWDKFKTAYYDKTVAEVVAKRKARELACM